MSAHQLHLCLVVLVQIAFSKEAVLERTTNVDCKLEAEQRILSVLPGSGWDNLVNEERGLTTNREAYTKCRLTPDGIYLIPDDVIIEPIKNTQIELTSETFSHFTNYTSLTALSINVAGDIKYDFISVGGDYSIEKDSIRKAEIDNNGLLVRSQLRYRWLAVHQSPDPELNAKFRNRLLDIARHLIKLNASQLAGTWDKGQNLRLYSEPLSGTIDRLQAAYLADLLVRDYGTHSIVDVEAGAVVARIDSLRSQTRYLTSDEKLQLKYAASAAFASLFNLKTSASLVVSDKELESYKSKVGSSLLVSHGGPSLKASSMNLSEWEDGVLENVVTVDRRGRPIYDLVTPRALPELSETLVFKLATALKAAVHRYYEANSVVGCLDPTSVAYDSSANVAAENCDSLPHIDPGSRSENAQLAFGGMYTTCEGPADLCSYFRLPNVATGAASCPAGYRSVSLLPPQVRRCAFSPDRKHRKECAVTHVFWCARDPSTVSTELGFLFGGVYTDTMVNPFTGTQSCPPYFVSQPVGSHTEVCLSTEREFGGRYSLPFGGFYACQSGNPLFDMLSVNKTALKNLMENRRKFLMKLGAVNGSGKKKGDEEILSAPKQCPRGYTSHVAGIEDTCMVNYCVLGGSLGTVKERRLRRPPFIRLPEFTSVEPQSRGNFDVFSGESRPYDGLLWSAIGLLMAVVLMICVAIAVIFWMMYRNCRKASISTHEEVNGEHSSLPF